MSIESLSSAGALVPLAMIVFGTTGFFAARARRVGAKYASAALALGGIFAVAAIYDVARGMPLVPVALCALGIGAMLAASAYRGVFLAATLIVWAVTTAGILWSRPDWSHVRKHVVANTQTSGFAQLDAAVYTPGDRSQSYVLPMLSHVDTTTASHAHVYLTFVNSHAEVRFRAQNATVTVPGGAAQPVALSPDPVDGDLASDVLSGSTQRYLLSTPLERDRGLERWEHHIVIRIPLAAAGADHRVAFDLEIRHPDRVERGRVQIDLQTTDQVQLRAVGPRL